MTGLVDECNAEDAIQRIGVGGFFNVSGWDNLNEENTPETD